MSKQQEAPDQLELVRAFVNTIDIEAGEEQLGGNEQLATWLKEHDLAPSSVGVTAPELGRALELREALRAALLANNDGSPVPAAAVDALDRAARRGQVALRFAAGGASSLQPAAEGVDAALGRLLAIVHGARASGTWVRLKACREHSCVWAFYDHTKNRSGTWCNMQVCGNRAKARAYRSRRSRLQG